MPQISSELRLLFKIYSHSGMGTKCEHLYDGSGGKMSRVASNCNFKRAGPRGPQTSSGLRDSIRKTAYPHDVHDSLLSPHTFKNLGYEFI